MRGSGVRIPSAAPSSPLRQIWLKDAIETHLRHDAEKLSRRRIKRLRGLRRPQHRLRVGEIRIFYDISGATVEILAIVAKSEAEAWLAQFGSPG